MQYILTEPGFTFNIRIITKELNTDEIKTIALSALKKVLPKFSEEEIIEKLSIFNFENDYSIEVDGMTLMSAKLFKETLSEHLNNLNQ